MRSFILIVLTLTSMSAYAYVGPGLGLGVIGALIGGVVAILLAVAGVIWYPFKRLAKKFSSAGRKSNETNKTNSADQKKKDKVEVEQSDEA